MTNLSAVISLPGQRPVLAFDVGGTDIKSGIVDPDGSVLGLQRTKTPRSSLAPGDSIVECIVELVRSYRQSYPSLNAGPIGVAVPGIVDEATGTGVYSANLGWEKYPFVRALESQLDGPVAFGHDVGSAGEAEFRLGNASSSADACFIAIGTGIASVVYADGRRIRGAGFAGEIGQAPIRDGLAPYDWTILEDVASAASITKRCNRLTGETVGGAEDVMKAAAAGNPEAVAVWDSAVHSLAVSLAHCVTLMGTTSIVVGGGLSLAGDALFSPLKDELAKMLRVHPVPSILPAKFGGNAGLVGSALRASDLHVSLERSG